MKTEDVNGKPLESWTPEEVKAAQDRGEIVLIDVRTPQEYMMEHIEGALLMPMSFFDPDALPTEEGKRLVFHCGSGMRSGKVAKSYLEAGRDRAAHMEGGMGGWKQAKLPHVATDMATGAPKKVGG
jgi:rhodanese-related sulfurtransferase